MDDTPAKENPEKDFNKIDLSQLQGFSFGTQWTQDKSSPSDRREHADRPRREGGAPDRRDRRVFRKPAGGDMGGPGNSGVATGVPTDQRERRPFADDRGPRRDFRGPRRDAPGGGYPSRGEFQERGPYDSPFFNVAFYPEDTSFNALAKTIRTSCRTIELFEIARTVVGKLDRFVVVLTRRTSAAKPADAGAGAPETKTPLYLSGPDGMPFDTEEAAIAHVLSNHLDRFFDMAEVEIDPPKGNFLVINKCGVTGELLGPPNYHRYAHIIQQHHAAKLARMPFEAFRSRIETVRDPEVVNQWLEKMKKATRYTWKQGAKPPAPPPKATPETAAPETAVHETAGAGAEVAAPDGSTAPDTAPAITFDNFEDARTHLLTQAREKIVRPVEHARFHGKLVETMPQGEIHRAIEGALERQRRFPLDTANALRGRLRREHFTIFKKGSKGISYVCAVKRKFRVPGQTFADSISTLITFIEANPMVRASALAAKFLGIEEPAAKPAEATSAPVETPVANEPTAATGEAPAEAAPAAAAEPVAPVEAAPVAAGPVLTIEQRTKISRMQGDLRWLVTEGYVTEFIDGRLFAPPPTVEARKKEVEAEENDPENFPEAPMSNPPFDAPTNAEAPAAEAAPVEPAATTEAVTEPRPADPEPAPEAQVTAPPATDKAVEAPAVAAEIPVQKVEAAAPPVESRPAIESPPPVENRPLAEPEAVLANAPGEPEVKIEAPPSD